MIEIFHITSLALLILAGLAARAFIPNLYSQMTPAAGSLAWGFFWFCFGGIGRSFFWAWIRVLAGEHWLTVRNAVGGLHANVAFDLAMIFGLYLILRRGCLPSRKRNAGSGTSSRLHVPRTVPPEAHPSEIAMYEITTRVALEVASHEAIIRQAYKDSVGVWTWSVGLTSNSGHKVERYIDNPQPMKRCLEVWLWAMERYATDVKRAFHSRPLEEHEFGAALSFHWNTGAIASASWVKLWLDGRMMRRVRRSCSGRSRPRSSSGGRRNATCSSTGPGRTGGT